MTPLTLQFGPWSPDNADTAIEVPAIPGPLPIPCADCLNVFYQDGKYRTMMGPSPTGPSLGSQALAAFTWYDNTSADEIVFAATGGGISALIDGSWVSVPVFNQQSVTVAPLTMTMTLGSFQHSPSWLLNFTLGTVSEVGQLYNGTLVSAVLENDPPVHDYGFQAGVGGSLTPAADVFGHVISQLYYHQVVGSNNAFFLTINASVPQTYFTELIVGSSTLLSSAAGYTSSGGQTTWGWVVSAGFLSTGSYAVQINT